MRLVVSKEAQRIKNEIEIVRKAEKMVENTYYG